MTGITVTDAGSGYSASPTIIITPPTMNLSYTTYWSHDGTSSAGGEPVSVVPVSVSQGLFAVGLGDTMIPNMSALPPQVLANPDVRMRMWFNDGVNGFSQLSPDQRLTSTAYAMMADTVRDGAITAAKLAPNSITSAQIAPGSITASQLADGAVTSAKLAASVNLGPPRGSIVMSADANDTNLIAAGYARIPGARVQTEEWNKSSSATAIPARNQHSAIWTGTEMIVWGGLDNAGFSTGGGRYNPVSNNWIALPTNGSPQGLYQHDAVWTGTEMILWGGAGAGVYNLQSNTWRSVSTQDEPVWRRDGNVVWTGTEMIVWNGAITSGGRYNPVTDVWSPVSSINAPSGEAFGIWSGTEMVLWKYGGGGGRYNPVSNTWRGMPTDDSPSRGSMAVWTGSEMIVWGGEERDGGIYNPQSNSWKPMSMGGPVGACTKALWADNRMLVVAGWDSLQTAMYAPGADSWLWFSNAGAPFLHDDSCGYTIVWTGTELLLYGGGDSSGVVYRASPSPTMYLFQKQ